MDAFEKSTIEKIQKYIQEPGKTLVFCDGGNKKREFNLFAKYLKVGDIIMGHDYAKDAKVFQSEVRAKKWNWHELDYASIASAVEENGLKPCLGDEFENYVIASYYKA